MNNAEQIIERFGGTRPLATALGKAPTTVQSWKESGHIPAKHQNAVLEAARAAGIGLEPADFFDADTSQEPAE